MQKYRNVFENIIAPENLFAAWDAFKKCKRGKRDVMRFEYRLEENLFALQRELANHTYRHGSYYGFFITDPKQRHIHKASVRDRIVHHAVFSVLNPLFEKTFIYDSYSCRRNKGTHKGVNRLRTLLRRASRNTTLPCIAVKCDVKKFFQSVDHDMLLRLIARTIEDDETLWLVREIVESFRPGLPIGNLTSQLFANCYLNELDRFVKHTLKVRRYIRYTDDFILIHENRGVLAAWVKEIENFLEEKLILKLHPNKIMVRTYHQGIDFLGYVQFPHHRLVRIKTKKRILKKVRRGISDEALQSYMGVLFHADTHRLGETVRNEHWLHRVEMG